MYIFEYNKLCSFGFIGPFCFIFIFFCLIYLKDFPPSVGSAGQACDKGFQWERAVELLDRMVERDGVKPNLFAFNHAMSACVRQVIFSDVIYVIAFGAKGKRVERPVAFSWVGCDAR